LFLSQLVKSELFLALQILLSQLLLLEQLHSQFVLASLHFLLLAHLLGELLLPEFFFAHPLGFELLLPHFLHLLAL